MRPVSGNAKRDCRSFIRLVHQSFPSIARAERLVGEAAHLEQWLDRGYHGSMLWMERNREKRFDQKPVTVLLVGLTGSGKSRLLRELIEDTLDEVGDRCAVAVRLAVDELMGPEGITT